MPRIVQYEDGGSGRGACSVEAVGPNAFAARFGEQIGNSIFRPSILKKGDARLSF